MLEFNEALEKISKHVRRLLPVKLSIAESLGFVLAEDIRTKDAIPLFDSSSVDGYAVRFQDIHNASDDHPVHLEMQSMVSAGFAPPQSLKLFHTIKIMTGAVLPKKADAVVMKEFVKTKGETIIFTSVNKRRSKPSAAGRRIRQGRNCFLQGNNRNPARYRDVRHPRTGIAESVPQASRRAGDYRK